MPHRRYLIRQATSLLRYAKETKNPEVAAVLLVKAAEFNDKVDEQSLPKMDVSPRAPDVKREP